MSGPHVIVMSGSETELLDELVVEVVVLKSRVLARNPLYAIEMQNSHVVVIISISELLDVINSVVETEVSEDDVIDELVLVPSSGRGTRIPHTIPLLPGVGVCGASLRVHVPPS